MIASTARCIMILSIVGIVLFTSMGRVTAQQPTLYWMVITLKIQLVEGKPLMTLGGPFPSADMCNVSLKAGLEGLKQQGIEPASSGCRTDVTIVVPG